MQRLVLTARATLRLEDVPIPRPAAGEILLRNIVAGICRTDRKCFRMGQRDLVLPRVLGHELAGVVHATGPGVTGYRPGDRVQLHPGIGCGHCDDCRQGNDQLCRQMQIFGFHLDGGFSTYTLIPPAGVQRGVLQKLPDALRSETAALAEPLACAVNMAERLDFARGRSLLIVGGGVLGLLTAGLAKCRGLTDVVILEQEPAKAALAQAGGFPVLPADSDDAELLRTRPRGFDLAIPCCPDNDGWRRAVKLLKKRGQLGFFSGLTAETPLDAATLNRIHYNELAVFGAYGCGLRHSKAALQLLCAHEENFRLPTKTITLEEAPRVLAQSEVRDTILTAIHF